MALTTSAVLAGIVLGADINQKTVHADTTNNNVATTTDEQDQAQQAVDQAQTKLDNAKQNQTTAQNQVSQATDTQNKVQGQVNQAQTEYDQANTIASQAQDKLDNANKSLAQVEKNSKDVENAKRTLSDTSTNVNQTAQAQQQAQNAVNFAQIEVESAASTVKDDQDAVSNAQNVAETPAVKKAQDKYNQAIQAEAKAKDAYDQAQTDKANADAQLTKAKQKYDEVVEASKKPENHDFSHYISEVKIPDDFNPENNPYGTMTQKQKEEFKKLNKLDDFTSQNITYVENGQVVFGSTVDGVLHGSSANKYFANSEEDLNTKYTLDSTHMTLPEDAVIKLSQYAAQLWNPIREKFGLPDFKVNKALVDITNDAMGYGIALGPYSKADRHQVLDAVAKKYGIDSRDFSYTIGGIAFSGNDDPAPHTVSLAWLKQQVFQLVTGSFIDTDRDSQHFLSPIEDSHYRDSIAISINGVGGQLMTTASQDPMNYPDAKYDPKTGNVQYPLGKYLITLVPYNPDSLYLKLAKTTYPAATSTAIPYHGRDMEAEMSKANDEYVKAIQNKQVAPNNLNKAYNNYISAQNDVQSAKSILQDEKSNSGYIDLKRAQNQLAKDQQVLAQAKSKLQSAQSQLDKAKSAHDSALAAQKDAQTKYDTLVKANNNLKTAQDQVDRAKQLVTQTQINLKNAKSTLDEKKALLTKVQAVLARSQELLAQANDQVTTAQNELATAQHKLDIIKAHNGSMSIIVDPSKPTSGASSTDSSATSQAGSNATSSATSSADPAVDSSASSQAGSSATSSATSTADPAVDSSASSQVGSSAANSATSSADPAENSPATTVARHANITEASVAQTRVEYKAQTKQGAMLPQTGNKSSLAMVLLGAATAMFGFGLANKKKEY